ncbi:NAD(P)/FAD-dependent oxidoreductase [Flammeovirga pacifica]|uniref:FAD-dependent oxidoreductase n=1 Tax=Flammeovirga pacifica TaxID=915059 RepID=A0A1S1YYV8_FLAPC|nr:FAD-dependent oxidoreductase [Flammeovirga pacifica]OHX66187.1 FAD-dependent oxidoreductase [Flammeovirga pacifica]
MISYWEKESFLNYHLIIIGSGIVGLSTALEYKEKHPNKRVLILEKGILPSGASTKNAGFACFGSLTEICDDLNNYSYEFILQTVQKRVNGLQRLRNRIGDKNMDYSPYGGYELIQKDQLHYLSKIDSINEMLHPIFHQKVFYDRTFKIKRFGFDSSSVEELLYNPLEGQIHTGKMMSTLLQKARSNGIEILTGVKVEQLEESNHHVDVITHQRIKFKAEQVAVCVNGFASDLLPDYEVKPGRGQVVITSPIENLPIEGTFHYDRGYYYFRNIDNRILIGGGRHLDYEGETTTAMETTNSIIQPIKKLLEEVILPDIDFTIEQQWSGIMGFGDKKAPIIEKLSDRIAVGIRMGGMGIAIGSEVGHELVDII